ncbi:TetR/AcrR family transcriptional regulator [Streptomyces sp. TRM70350]|uniref:TetR/AcrR family transcriptional regulator n=1 Tax=Streptomyces sp. TRM70350 TaxID=2856165 RepID=UPI001C458175|nr:TetR/AcrR family transcriptional regulator [Streptomyces sp. TRM70350]MBV7699962.1 TetR/AcrR family transcriptional regulator [Streptomyces sp. TRM70350]
MTAAHSPTPADRSRPGLRERKKTKTRAAIRTAAYALIEEQGYDATTIEQIADRAEVSPSTVFRYFPAKEDIVLTDEHDPLLSEELRARPADEPWLRSMRHVMRKAIGVGEAPEVTRLRCRLLAEVPAVRSRMMESMSQTGNSLAEAIGERTGRDPQGLEVRVLTMSLIGGLMEVSQYWARTGFREDLTDLVDRALTVYEHGLTS